MIRQVVTLFDVVKTVQDTAQSDRETIAVLAHLLKSKRVRYARDRGSR